MIDELRALHESQRQAHLDRDAQRLVALFADDFVSVHDGQVSRPDRAASLERFERYFARVTFRAWDDVTPPVVEVSDDATLATILVTKRVHVDYVDEEGQPAEEVTDFAWTEVWRRREGPWELAMVISTRRPDA